MKDFLVIPMFLSFENWDFCQIPSQVCSKTTHKPKKLMFNFETTFVLFSFRWPNKHQVLNYLKIVSKNTLSCWTLKYNNRHFLKFYQFSERKMTLVVLTLNFETKLHIFYSILHVQNCGLIIKIHAFHLSPNTLVLR